MFSVRRSMSGAEAPQLANVALLRQVGLCLKFGEVCTYFGAWSAE